MGDEGNSLSNAGSNRRHSNIGDISLPAAGIGRRQDSVYEMGGVYMPMSAPPVPVRLCLLRFFPRLFILCSGTLT